jgi:hypothetical protein
MGITEELAALQIDSLEHAVDQVSPIRAKYLREARELSAREQASEVLTRSRQQSVTDECDKAIQLATARLWPAGTVCTRSLNLLSPAERNGL